MKPQDFDIRSHNSFGSSPESSKKEISPEYTPTKFEDLPTSTSTIMIYSNIMFNHRQIFRKMPVFHIRDPPLTKKKKTIDKKALTSPYGTVLGIQFGIYYRGIRMSKNKKYWCPYCQLVTDDDDQILTVEEEERSISKKEAKELKFPMDVVKLQFKCKTCNKYVEAECLDGIKTFLNQVTVVISVGDTNINVMIFKDNFKLAGNKNFRSAIETIMLLWEEYIQSMDSTWTFRKFENGPYCDETIAISDEKNKTTFMDNPQGDVHFLFDVAMRNVDFHLNFSIDKKKLDMLMNQPKYSHMVFQSKYESTSVTHVNIKMHAEKPENLLYDMLVYSKGGKTDGYFVNVNEKLYAKDKKRPKKFTTLIVFSSSEIIMSGKLNCNMKKSYEFFLQTAYENKKEISECLELPKLSLMEFMKRKEEANITPK
jgi:hypothetical protein